MQQIRESAPNTVLHLALQDLYKTTKAAHLVITAGKHGAWRISEPGKIEPYAPIPARLVDTCGAGDAVAAALTYATITGQSIDEAVKFAMAAGAVAVEQLGAHPVGAHDVYRKLLHTKGAASKIMSLEEAKRLRTSVKLSGQKFGITNGVFDLLHIGHLDMLQKAAKECDFLLVLVNTDASAEKIKRKPVNNQELRTKMLAGLPYVDAVATFQDDTPITTLAYLDPDVLIKGPGYTAQSVPWGTSVVARGGRFVSTERQYTTSTTATIESVKQRANDQSNTETTTSSGST
jgi:D-beta-D-heptose 7-phosphate kinase/D-beta-D-heptose 1-phosphate adenosyltransferase